MAPDHTGFGEFALDGLVPAPQRVPKIEVSFDIEANRNLVLAARDTATGKPRSLRIAGSTRLPEEGKKRRVDEAERYAEAGKRRREDAEKLNDADSLCYQAEKMLADVGAKRIDDLRSRVQAAYCATREEYKKRDVAAAAEKTESQRKLLDQAAVIACSQTQGQGAAVIGKRVTMARERVPDRPLMRGPASPVCAAGPSMPIKRNRGDRGSASSCRRRSVRRSASCSSACARSRRADRRILRPNAAAFLRNEQQAQP